MSDFKYDKKLIVSVLIIIFIIFFLSLFVKIDLSTADLGRHIKNGEIITSSVFSGNTETLNEVLKTNFYSYTEGSEPFINHHWLSGVLFFILFKIFGFSGLSLIYIILFAFSLYLFIYLAKKETHILWIIPFVISAIPILAYRSEIRPEIFSFLFLALYIYIFWLYSKNKIKDKYIWFILLLQVIWVNSHISFVFGLFIIGVFLFEEIIKKNYLKIKKLSLLLFLTVVASLLNPSHIYGVLYPFKIFGIYTYRVFENQSINFVEGLNMGNPLVLISFKILLILSIISFILLIIVNRKKISIPLLIFNIVFAFMGYSALRNLPFFALISILTLPYNFYYIFNHNSSKFTFIKKRSVKITFLILVLISGLYFSFAFINYKESQMGIGLKDEALKSIKFFKENKLKGPIINNYDIGGYLIYGLYPKEKVYFDNRPETYTKNFVDNEYIKALENPDIFEEMDKKYNFNIIFFYYRDYTPWGQEFITKKVFDDKWAPIFVDNENIILIKRNKENESLIKKFEISKESFKILR